MAVVALAVGAIPEGLPAALTITLAIGVSKMAQRKAIVRKLPAVETLGSTTVICSDKTGTLTQNQMTVEKIFAGDKSFAVTAEGISTDSQPELLECIKAGCLCNDSNIVSKDGEWKVEGDPTETALVVTAQKAGMLDDDLLSKYTRIDAIPFESQHQYMAVLYKEKASGNCLAYIKGSVESILSRCDSAIDKDALHTVANDFADQGLRVLAFAGKTFSPDKKNLAHDDISTGIVFLGFQAMIDPPRPEAVSAVETCKTAGISVKMITGDHKLTAQAIAKK